MSNPVKDIRVGTIINTGEKYVNVLKEFLKHGAESFQIAVQPLEDGFDFQKLADETKETIGDQDAIVSSFFHGANPMGDEPNDKQSLKTLEMLIDNMHLFGADVLGCFSGRVRGASIPDSMEHFKKIWTPLVQRAADKGVRIAFENCSMGGYWEVGDWNLAHSPACWERMFNIFPEEHVGLDWEPCHQMVLLMDPVAQLKKWTPRIFNVHGKDATIHWDVVKEYGIHSDRPFAFHRTPGFGDSNWTDIITELRRHGYKGSIDVEGWHDPVYVGEMEMTGHVYAIKHLKHCRGGDFIPNPW